MKLKQIIKQKKNTRRKSSDLITKHIGDDIVLELGDIGNDVCSGHLQNYDGRLLEITDFKQHSVTLDSTINYANKRNPQCYIENPESIRYSLKTKNINAGLVASIQLYDEVISARKK
ncbi:hypothetical protein KAT80_03475 [Candidatus Pacearchaeota archaeon]|nr:hypothetical protein [Candidatus Pacearchaeota archaeon]